MAGMLTTSFCILSSLGGWVGKSKKDIERKMQEGELESSRSCGERGEKGDCFVLSFKYFISSEWSAPCLADLTIWKDELLTHGIHSWSLQISLL